MARLSVEQINSTRRSLEPNATTAWTTLTRDLLDTIDALQRELTDARLSAAEPLEQRIEQLERELAESERVRKEEGGRVNDKSHEITGLVAQLKEDVLAMSKAEERLLILQAQLAPAPCGIKGHRMCDWVPIPTPNVHADPDIREAHCLACEREAAAVHFPSRYASHQAQRQVQPQPTEVVLGTATVMVVGETRKPAVTIHPSGVFVILPDTFKPGDRVEIVARLRET